MLKFIYRIFNSKRSEQFMDGVAYFNAVTLAMYVHRALPSYLMAVGRKMNNCRLYK
jgi:hypothetical protein